MGACKPLQRSGVHVPKELGCLFIIQQRLEIGFRSRSLWGFLLVWPY